MRIEQVSVTGFGPLQDQTLALRPGLTVVVGGNESAKSSWHAATYAALCGLRRGQGLQERDRVFRRRHQPWSGGPWRVGARVVLDDGRVIDLTQELDDRVDCHAIDVGLGRDVSSEVMHDGAPDASRWLGLDRRAFEATACIRQAELLRVRDAGADLGELLGQAAATGARDESAAQALSRIERFRQEQVGTERANSVRPWRRALRAEEEARAALDHATSERAVFDRRANEVERRRAERDELRERLRRARASRAAAEAARLDDLAVQAEALAAALGPERPADDGSVQGAIVAVSAALAAWSSRPSVPSASSEQPSVRDVDVAVAYGGYRHAVERLEALGAEPQTPTRIPRARWPWAAVAAGAALAAAGLLAAQPVVGAVGVVVAVSGLVAALWRRSGVGAAADSRGALRAAAARDAESAGGMLRDALAAHGVPPVDGSAGVEQQYRAYQVMCQDAQAREAESARRAVMLAEDGLRAAGAEVGLDVAGVGSDEVGRALEEWLGGQEAAARGRRETLARWAELDRLVGHDGVDGVRRRAEAARAVARAAAVGLSSDDVADEDDVDDEVIAHLDRRCREVGELLASEEGALRQLAADLPDVAEREEQFASARMERERVEQLRAVLVQTSAFMAAAQDRVHRDIAPRLQASLNRWLPVVTRGRYVDATVDPRSLTVRVRARGGPWREAELLSFGTAEQVYLLLRLALVEHLTAGHDTCPLLLDDVTVHADRQRTQAILELLLAVSAERQVVLFTQEDQVAQWAREALADAPGSVVELDPVLSA